LILIASGKKYFGGSDRLSAPQVEFSMDGSRLFDKCLPSADTLRFPAKLDVTNNVLFGNCMASPSPLSDGFDGVVGGCSGKLKNEPLLGLRLQPPWHPKYGSLLVALVTKWAIIPFAIPTQLS
jgi:hypothetical protein